MAEPGLSLRSKSFGGRVVGALRLDPDSFEDVEHDGTAFGQALVVVLASSFANGLGAVGVPEATASLVTSTMFALAGWIIWSSIIFIVGSKLLPEPQTEASVGELLRTTGFAAAPGLFGVVGLVSGIGPALHFLVTVWMFVAMLIAVRQALDFGSVWRALGVVAIGYVPYLALVMVAATLARS